MERRLTVRVLDHMSAALGLSLGLLATQVGAGGGTLTVGAVGGIAPLNPVITRITVAANLFDVLFTSLLTYDADTIIAPGLASSWEASEDRRVWHFQLRDDLTFHDGAPVTAADVVFTFGLFSRHNESDGDGPSPVAVAVAPYQIRVTFSEPAGMSDLLRIRHPILPRHVIEPELASGKALADLDFNRQPVGSGPFQFVGWQGDGEVTLAAYEDHVDGRALLDTVVVKAAYADTDQLWGAAMRGEVDVVTRLSPRDMASVASDTGLRKIWRETPYYMGIACNCRLPGPLSDVRVRQAVSLAIDRRALWDRLSGPPDLPDEDILISGPLHPGSAWASPDVPLPCRDVALAERLLAEAGWHLADGDDFRRRDGDLLALHLLMPQEYPYLENAAARLRQDLEHVGIQLSVRAEPFRALVPPELAKVPFDLLWGGGRFEPDPALGIARWRTGDPGNVGGYSNVTLDRLADEAAAEQNLPSRQQLYQLVHLILATEVPSLFIGRVWSALVVREGLAGLDSMPQGLFRALHRLHWLEPKG